MAALPKEDVANVLHYTRSTWVERYTKLLENGGSIVAKARCEARIEQIEDLMTSLKVEHDKSTFN